MHLTGAEVLINLNLIGSSLRICSGLNIVQHIAGPGQIGRKLKGRVISGGKDQPTQEDSACDQDQQQRRDQRQRPGVSLSFARPLVRSEALFCAAFRPCRAQWYRLACRSLLVAQRCQDCFIYPRRRRTFGQGRDHAGYAA